MSSLQVKFSALVVSLLVAACVGLTWIATRHERSALEDPAAGVRYRAAPNGAILGTWPQGLRLLWMGVHGQDADWWHVWNPADWSQVGWTHRSLLRGVA